MRVAYLTDEFPVLSQSFVLNQVRGLIERGHEVELFADWQEPSEAWVPEPLRSVLRAATRAEPAIPRTRLARIASAGRIVAAATRASRPALLRALNVMSCGVQAASLRLVHLAARFASSSGGYDAVRACFGPNGVRALMLRNAGAFVGPIATSFHGYDLSSLAGSAARHYPSLFASSEVMLPTSDALAAELIRRGCLPDRIEVLPSAIDCTMFQPGADPPDHPFHAVSIGRLVEKKGFEFGIEAVAELARRGVDVRYTIAGDGPLRSMLESKARECGVGDRVELVGAVFPTGVRDLLRRAHLLVAPSVLARTGDQESRVNVIKEAMACAVPVVASRHGGITELVDDGENGLLVEERDSAGIARAIERLAGDAELRRGMGTRGLASVVRTYDIESLTIRLETIIARLGSPAMGTGVTE